MHVADTLTKAPRALPDALRKAFRNEASRALWRKDAAQAAFQRADDFWGRELQREFGDRAGDARYTAEGMGKEGSRLRFAHDQRERLRIVYERAQDAYSEACERRYRHEDPDTFTDDVCRCRECAA